MRTQSTGRLVLLFSLCFLFSGFVPSFSFPLWQLPSRRLSLLAGPRPATTLPVPRVALNEIAFITSIALPFDEESPSREATLPFDFSRHSHRAASKRKKLWRVYRLGSFALLQYRSRINIRLGWRKTLGSLFTTKAHASKLYAYKCTVIHYQSILRSKLYENRRPGNVAAREILSEEARPIWRITESLKFNFQWQAGWLMFCSRGRASLSIGRICVSYDRNTHPADAHFAPSETKW